MAKKAFALNGIIKRCKALYTGAVADVLDSLGLRQQVLPYAIARSRPT